MPKSPLPQREGLDAAWVRTPGTSDCPSLRDYLVERLNKVPAERIDEMFAEERFVDDHGNPIPRHTPYLPNALVWFHRDLPVEAEVPFPIPILYQDERIVVVDKPHFLSTIPRGRHIRQSALVKLRNQLGLPELGAAHRLDLLTAGVLLFTTEKRWRGPYQLLFEYRKAEKQYEAVAPWRPELELPMTVKSHIVKVRGHLIAEEIPGAEPNAETLVELISHDGQYGRYRLTPRTGKTHQLRLHLSQLGIPIKNDPFYPEFTDQPLDDFSRPLQLLARSLSFTDPIDGTDHQFVSTRELTGSN